MSKVQSTIIIIVVFKICAQARHDDINMLMRVEARAPPNGRHWVDEL